MSDTERHADHLPEQHGDTVVQPVEPVGHDSGQDVAEIPPPGEQNDAMVGPPYEGEPITDETPILGAEEPELVMPEIATYTLAGGYAGAAISRESDPNGPNLAMQVQVRNLIAVDEASLDIQMIACLISDYGLTQEQAEELVTGQGVPQEDMEGEPEEELEDHELEGEEPVGEQRQDFAPEPEHQHEEQHSEGEQRREGEHFEGHLEGRFVENPEHEHDQHDHGSGEPAREA